MCYIDQNEMKEGLDLNEELRYGDLLKKIKEINDFEKESMRINLLIGQCSNPKFSETIDKNFWELS